MEQNQQPRKFHVVVTNTETGETVFDVTESTVIAAVSNIADVQDGADAWCQTFLNGDGMEIAQAIESNDTLYKCALLAQLMNTLRKQQKEDAQ